MVSPGPRAGAGHISDPSRNMGQILFSDPAERSISMSKPEEGIAHERESAEPLRLDYLIKARAIHSMTGQTYRSVGLREPEIVAVSTEPDGLRDLAEGDTVVVDAGGLAVLPAFPIRMSTSWRLAATR